MRAAASSRRSATRGSSTRRTLYDALGGLERDEDAAGGFHALVRTSTTDGFTVTRTTGEGRASTFLVEQRADGGRRRRNTFPSGLETDVQVGTDGARTTTFPDGQVTTVVPGADPRFGMQAPRSSSVTISVPVTVPAPGYLTSTLTESRAVTLADPGDPLSLTSATTTFTLNDKEYRREFDAATGTVTDITPLERRRVTTLDSLGRVVAEQLGNLASTTIAHDARGRVETITRGTGAAARVYRLTYETSDPRGRLEYITDPLDRVVRFTYDDADRVRSQILPDLRVVQYDYDANGNVTVITPPGRPAHGFDYTPVDLQEMYEPPPVLGSGTTNTLFDHDLDRQLDLITRPDGQVIDPEYDPTTGRLDTLTTPTRTLTYEYDDDTGNLSRILGSDGTRLDYGYDGPLLISNTWVGTVAGSVSRTYDDTFRVATTTVTTSGTAAQTATVTYDDDGLLETVTGPAPAGMMTFVRYPETGLLDTTMLGVVSDKRMYTPFGELARYRTTVNGVEALLIEYTVRDKLGRIREKRETRSGVTTTFGYNYDDAGRLWTVTRNGVEIASYTYDANGNRRTAPNLPTPPPYPDYDDQDRLLTFDDIEYTYTANGELATKTVGADTTEYTYDALGNLRTVELPTGAVIEYVVDAVNRRIGKKVDDVLVQGFLWEDQLRVSAELGGAGNVIARFVYGAKVNVPEYMVKGGAVYRLLTDHLGSPRLVVNVATGAIAQELEYDEFGRRTVVSGPPDFQPFGFAGGLYDTDTGFVRLGARDYDPSTGRWTVKDPLRFFGSRNFYAYAADDPVNLSDPTGLTALTFDSGAGTLTVDPEVPGQSPYTMGASSGQGSPDPSAPWAGPIPPGQYTIDPSQLTDPGRFGDILRNLRGDWGDWRVPLIPYPGTETYGRSGFFLHGGQFPGSAGCIDAGGGLFGNDATSRLKTDILGDPDGLVPVVVY